MNKTEEVVAWFTALSEYDIKEILDELSTDERARARDLLAKNQADQNASFGSAVRVSESILEITGEAAKKLGFALPKSHPELTTFRLTNNMPEDQAEYPENTRVNFESVCRNLKKLLNEHEPKNTHGDNPPGENKKGDIK